MFGGERQRFRGPYTRFYACGPPQPPAAPSPPRMCVHPDLAPNAARSIVVRGAREHNLQRLDVAIPRDRMVVITGVSGSGKSSLAFDTIFAEGQRKYMESLSAYARQFLNQMQKPDVEEITGLPPTIAIEQRSGGHTPRSTVATTTEIYDYLRLLMARCGTPTCWARVGGTDEKPLLCGKPIAATPATQITDAILALATESTASGESGRSGKAAAGSPPARVMICAPVIRGRKGFHREVAEALQKQGFVRARVNGTVVDLREVLKDSGENPLKLGRYEMHTIEAVVDRLAPDAESRQRLAESVEVALRVGQGVLVVLVERDGAWVEHRFSEKYACPDHPECAIDELEPRLFSFNSPHGACPQCAGLGTVSEFDLDLVVPDHELPVAEAIEPWRRNGPQMNMYYHRLIRRFCERMGVKPATPFKRLPKAAVRVLLHGTTDADVEKLGFAFEGVIPNLHRRYEKSESDLIRERLRGFMTNRPCPACGGRRLRPEALHVKLAVRGGGGGSRVGAPSVDIAQIVAMTIERAVEFFPSVHLTTEQARIAEPILREINARLGFLASVGLDYLSLDRASSTLSGGEAQRIRLATQVGSGLVGVCYVLDEPTIGLHQRDNDRLVATLRRLTDIGNSVLVVEHDEDTIRAADHVLDIGPGPGRSGGRVVAQGSVEEICAVPESLTGQYLSGRRRIAVPAKRRSVAETNAVVVKKARENNLKSIDVAFPLGGIVCVTGVSGSGKSTLVNEILLKAVQRAVHAARALPGEHERVTGVNKVDRVVEVDQSPIGRTPRSNPATYTGIFDDIRKLFAGVKESKIRGYEPGRFSFNVKGGRCEACQGQGVRRIEMHFLPDVFVTCEVCKGTRYAKETLEILFKGKSIAEVLDMTVTDARRYFEAHPKVLRMVECLHDVGLDYIQLGQPATTLSGGEAQRIKLASELGGAPTGHTLYVLDEPTTGLHFADVDRLLTVLHRLADAGNTLVVIEHNLDVIKCADWIIDLGPEGGERGGRVVATGTPEQVAKAPGSFTGKYLRTVLG